MIEKKIAKWGNSLGIRLPKSVALEAKVAEGDPVSLIVRKGVIVVRPSRPAYSLDRLLAKVTARNRRNSSVWDAPNSAGPR